MRSRTNLFVGVSTALLVMFSSGAMADNLGSVSNAQSSSSTSSGAVAAPNQQIRFGDSHTDNDTDIPVSSAIAPSSISQAPCQGWKSASGQFFGFGGGGGGSHTIGWCVALLFDKPEVAHQMMCDADASYKAAIEKVEGASCIE